MPRSQALESPINSPDRRIIDKDTSQKDVMCRSERAIDVCGCVLDRVTTSDYPDGSEDELAVMVRGVLGDSFILSLIYLALLDE
ncbi:hypothetical protein VTL71DRAFT_15737 [Oculimacula yallundae]|uniref:Uncharacterized protein n=1 Tax=Oculimacula yallundae TaxID=86028 RepID=A0ABR4CDW4_9HELO